MAVERLNLRKGANSRQGQSDRCSLGEPMGHDTPPAMTGGEVG